MNEMSYLNISVTMERIEDELSREREKNEYLHTKGYNMKYDIDRSALVHHKDPNEVPMAVMPQQGPARETPEEGVRCNICDKTFPRQANLTRHQKIHYKFKDDEQFPCSLCHKKFTSKQRLVFHTRNHNNKIYKCMLCNRKFGKPNSCEICKMQGNLLTCPHVAPPYACEDCDTKFHYIPAQQNFLSTDQPFTCKFCSEKLSNIKLLRKHLDTHSEKPFSCNTCSKCFPSRWKLRLHEQTHFNMTPYRCYMCPQRFSTTGNFKRHMKRVHNIK